MKKNDEEKEENKTIDYVSTTFYEGKEVNYEWGCKVVALFKES